MANTFAEKVTRFMPILDEIYKRQSKTSVLEDSAAVWVGTNKIKLPKIEMDGPADYDRDDGYVRGGVTISYGEYELEFDRGRSFQIDWVDDDETGFDAFRTLMMEYVRTKEIPEFDATRISRIASRATEGKEADITVDTDFLLEFELARIALTDNEVPHESRVAFVTPGFLSGLKGDLKGAGRYSVQQNTTRFNFMVEEIDGVPLIEVPSSRMWDVIELLDGGVGETAGGYQPETTVSKAIHMIYGDINAMKAYMKRNASKVFTPETNPFADAFLVQYRNHHDLIVQDNKREGIYVFKDDTAYTSE